ncbi:MAG: hypothetical protein ACKO6N_28390 [Myxococcota bacterium]
MARLPTFVRSLLAYGLLMFLMVVVRVGVGAQTSLERAQQLEAQSQLSEAILQYENTLQWYVPLLPQMSTASESLLRLGAEAERLQRPALALEAYEALRGGLYATRSFYTPQPEKLAEANRRIAALQVKVPDARWPDSGLPETARVQVALETLQRPAGPVPIFSAMASFGFIGWVIAAAGFFLRAFNEEGVFQPRSAWRWTVALVLGYALWIVGLMNA